MKRIIFALLIILLPVLCLASNSNKVSFVNNEEFMPLVKEYFDLSNSSDPDLPCFKLAYINGKPHVVLGSQIGLIGSFSDYLNVILFLTPFIELYNFENQYIPWELWRGSVGIETYWESEIFNKEILPFEDRIVIKLGVSHESDHYTSREYTTRFANISNSNFSSIEYVTFRIFYSVVLGNELNLILAIGNRYFIGSSDRELLHANNIESIIEYNIDKTTRMFASLYYEDISNQFNSLTHGFAILADSTPLRYFIVRAGINFINENGSGLQPYLLYTSSNGRGLDFLERTDGLGWGIRIILSY